MKNNIKGIENFTKKKKKKKVTKSYRLKNKK